MHSSGRFYGYVDLLPPEIYDFRVGNLLTSDSSDSEPTTYRLQLHLLEHLLG